MEVRTEGHFFGPGGRLMGFRAAPVGGAVRGSVLICPSLFSDVTRCEWSVRHLALRLATEGFDTFRFDFSGCGNSSGDKESRNLETWGEDLRAAVGWASSCSGLPLTAVVAIRAGVLAWGTAMGLPHVSRFVCWDPVAVGEAWFRMMRDLQVTYERRTPGSGLAYALGGHAVEESLAEELNDAAGTRIAADRLVVLRSKGSRPPDLSVPHRCVELDHAYDWTTWELHVFHAHDVIDSAVEALA